MSSDFSNLRTAINDKLLTVSELSTVYNFHTGKIDGFPAATFEPSGNEAELFTSSDNLRSYNFEIIIHQEMENTGRQNAIDILSQTVDAVLTAFDEDFNLGGVCDFCLALPSTWGEYASGDGAVKYAIMKLVCKREVSVV